MLRARLETILLTAARSEPEDRRVPYAFEKRVMAAIRALPDPGPWWVLTRVLWRAAALCLAVMTLSGMLVYYERHAGPAPETLTVDLENTVLAAVEHSGDGW
jgi:hypothetical protein